MKKNMSTDNRNPLTLKYIGIVLAVAALILGCTVRIDGVSEQAMRTCGVLAATLFLQVFESFHLVISCLLSSALLFGFGCVGSISEAFSGYTNHVLYFTIASFGISAAFQKSAISRKLVSLIMRSEEISVYKVTMIFMVLSAALSSIMSNVAAVVIFIPFVEQYLDCFKKEEDRKKSARSMMICLVVAAMTGGIITPAGSSVNLIGIDLLEKYSGESIRFIDWVKAGLPLAIAILLVAFVIITRVFRPVDLSAEEKKNYIRGLKEQKELKLQDWYIIIVILGTLTTWVLSSWIPAINITFTSLIALCLFFIPGHEVLTWKEFSEVNSWAAFFVAGNHICIASAVVATGLCDYFARLLFQSGGEISQIGLIFKIAVITFTLMAILPAAPAVVTILCPIIVTFAVNAGWNPVMLALACVLCVPNIYLFPLDAPLIVAYDKKAFTMFELPRATLWIQLAIIGLVTLWIPVVFRFIG